MRTTIRIDDDVLDHAHKLANRINASFRFVINEALRAGLDIVEKPSRRRKYHTKPHAMGLRPGQNLDNVQELLAQAEKEDYR